MAEDGIRTTEEFERDLLYAQRNCERAIQIKPQPTDNDGNILRSYCKSEWDNLICWPHSIKQGVVMVPCPKYVPDFDPFGFAKRVCTKDLDTLKWAKAGNSSDVWVDYSACKKVNSFLSKNGTELKSLVQLYTVGYSFSMVALVFAMFTLAYFKRLHCTRNFIHMHLFASFILKAVFIFIKDHVLFIGSGIFDINNKNETVLPDNIEYQERGSMEAFGCKLVMTLYHYLFATNYYWILVEALYLHSLIFVAFFSDKKYLWRFTLTGWGVPVLFVVPWVIVRANLNNTGCWDIALSEYKWIYNGPIVVATVVNFLLFLNIIRVLWYKMIERKLIGINDNRKQYKKLVKSTLILIPMFGVHAIVFIAMPDTVREGPWFEIRMYFDLFFNSFQGFFVALIYCFFNGEVQTEFKRLWSRIHTSVEIRKERNGNKRSEHSHSVTMLTNVNNSTVSQANDQVLPLDHRL